jgi:hypothetical protein
MDGRSLEDMGTLLRRGGLACAGAGTHPSGARRIPGTDTVGYRPCGAIAMPSCLRREQKWARNSLFWNLLSMRV